MAVVAALIALLPLVLLILDPEPRYGVRWIEQGYARREGEARERRTYRTIAECLASCDQWQKDVDEALKYAVDEFLKFFDLGRLLGWQ